MCDTLGRITEKKALFGKNSDRSPNEVQITEYHPAWYGRSGSVKCTYISIPQVSQTYETLLSRPTWMWGAEIGVNEYGVCIGNEAVFTRGKYGKTGLTGMDLLRLALERSKTTDEARKTITELLEEFGQGGNCGYDHDFYYDNSFLIMDRQSLCVLETAGKDWICRYSDSASISNRLSITKAYDQCSAGEDGKFFRRHFEPVYSTFSGSAERRKQTQSCLSSVESASDLMSSLRNHNHRVKNPFAQGTVNSTCMHYGGTVGDHTTASMVVSLEPERTVIWSTGCSTPCVSLYKPWLFGTDPVLPVVRMGDSRGEEYWLAAERFRRSLIGKEIPHEFYEQRDEIQKNWTIRANTVSKEDFSLFSGQCLEEEKRFYQIWSEYGFNSASCSKAYLNRWKKKNQVQQEPDRK